MLFQVKEQPKLCMTAEENKFVHDHLVDLFFERGVH